MSTEPDIMTNAIVEELALGGDARSCGSAALAALTAAGYAVIKLPEPDADGRWRIPDTDIEVRTKAFPPPDGPELQIIVNTAIQGVRLRKCYDLSVAPEFAAALLAAAAKAEK